MLLIGGVVNPSLLQVLSSVYQFHLSTLDFFPNYDVPFEYDSPVGLTSPQYYLYSEFCMFLEYNILITP